MKKLFLLGASLCSLTLFAQTKKAPVKKPITTATAKKPATSGTATILKSLTDSASYAIGISVANFYSQQGMKNLNAAMVSKAINDVLSGKKPALDDYQANNIIMRFMNQAQEAKSRPNILAGEKFLAANKGKAGVKITPSGLQYEVIKEGTGPKPTAADSVTCHYAGTLIDGTEFDNSYKRGEPITFALGGVIKGWTEALQLMPAGSKYKLYIPQQLGYGTNDMGAIPAGSVLIFEVELLKVVGK